MTTLPAHTPIGPEDVVAAAERIAPFAHRTPVFTCRSLDALTGARLFFKCENLQKVGAFKFRGATNAVQSLSNEAASRGVATHSSGNHAQALALAARDRGVAAHIVMPDNAPRVKIDGVRGYGGEITFCKPTLAAREATLDEVVARTGATVIHPYNDVRIVTGQATCARELFDEVGELDIITAPVGGGGTAERHGSRNGVSVAPYGRNRSRAGRCRRCRAVVPFRQDRSFGESPHYRRRPADFARQRDISDYQRARCRFPHRVGGEHRARHAKHVGAAEDSRRAVRCSADGSDPATPRAVRGQARRRDHLRRQPRSRHTPCGFRLGRLELAVQQHSRRAGSEHWVYREHRWPTAPGLVEKAPVGPSGRSGPGVSEANGETRPLSRQQPHLSVSGQLLRASTRCWRKEKPGTLNLLDKQNSRCN